MENYFFNTPVYKIWMDIISTLSHKSSFIINELGFGFIEIKCNREGVVDTYQNNIKELQLEYSHENRSFFCRLLSLKDGSIVSWKTKPPEIKRVSDLNELEAQIDLWLKFIAIELS